MKNLILEPFPTLPLTSKIKLFLKCLVLSFVIKVVGVWLISFSSLMGLKEVLILKQAQSKITDYYTLSFSLILVIAIYPILEEFAFRGWFSTRKGLMSISLSILSTYIFYILIYRWLGNFVLYTHSVKISLIAILSIVCFLCIHKNINVIQRIISKFQKLFIFFSLLTFGMVHIFNYKFDRITPEAILAIVIIILPHFFVGYLFTHVRIRNGLIWSIALHVIGNSLIIIPVLLGHRDI